MKNKLQNPLCSFIQYMTPSYYLLINHSFPRFTSRYSIWRAIGTECAGTLNLRCLQEDGPHRLTVHKWQVIRSCVLVYPGPHILNMFSFQVARVQPLVPDVTLFFPSSTAISQVEPLREVPIPQPQLQPAQRKPLAPINSNREGAPGGQRPPSPTKCKQLDATADFSISSDTQVRGH